MTGPKRHKRPPNQFRRRSLIIMAVVTTMVVALGVGTASAGLRGDRNNWGWKNNQQGQGHGHGKPWQSASASTTAAPSASTSDDPANPGESSSADPSASVDPSASATDPAGGGADPSATDPAEGGGEETEAPATGPVPEDFVNIRQVRPTRQVAPRPNRNGSRGTFRVNCAINGDGFNSDNVIVAPGVDNGAHHLHEYAGNKTTSGKSTNESLAAGGTTCSNGDQSTYYWPVVRDITKDTPQRFTNELEEDLNVGAPLTPRVSIQFKGNPTQKVVAMPKFLRIITGDAKAFTNGGGNANAHFTCTGFTNRITTDKYPLCPGGRGMQRTFAFQNCWDGQNADSSNHRSHVAFSDPRTGACPSGFKAIPQLTMTLTYNVPTGPNWAVDGFPEQLHKPINDHDDFINVMNDGLMNRMVQCINTGRRC